MKKSILLFLLLFPTFVRAQEAEIDGLWYNFVGTEAQVTTLWPTYYSEMGSVVIPATVTFEGQEYRVTSIANNTFSTCSGLTSITIPEGVTTIGSKAFTNCDDLRSITLPSNLTSLGSEAFSYCPKLTDIPLPAGLTSIEEGTFNYCTGLKRVVIPDGVTSIGDKAFTWCSSLTSLTIGTGLSTIGSGAFSCCSNLESIRVAEGNPFFDSRDNCNAIIATAQQQLVYGCQNTVVPNGVTSIRDYAFANCKHLRSIVLPQSLTHIGAWAFNACSELTSVSLPSGLTTLGDHAFTSCSHLTDIVLPRTLTSIGDGTFRSCSWLKNIAIPEGVKTIGQEAFFSCTSLSTVVLPSSLESLGAHAFRDSYLNEVYCLSATPPATAYWTFENSCCETAVLYVPASSTGSYQSAAGWSRFGKILAIETSSVSPTVAASPTDATVIYDLNGRVCPRTTSAGTPAATHPRSVFIKDGRKQMGL